MGALVLGVAVTRSPVMAQESVRLEHVRRYDDLGKHVMSASTMLGSHTLVTTSDRLCLVDLSPQQPVSGCVSQIDGLDSTTVTPGPGGYFYVNLRTSGFAIVFLDDRTLSLALVDQVSEPGVFFEKMTVIGNRLYVAAHSAGIRIYDISAPASPVLVGSLSSGFHDAWDVAVAGSVVYVADGAGGLKIVDLSDETSPAIIAGEDPIVAAGTSEAVLLANNHVYVAAGGAGVAVYELGNLSSRRRYDTPVCAVNLAQVGPYLAVADVAGIRIFRFEPDGSLADVAHEGARYAYEAPRLTIRLWYGVAGWGGNQIVAANWSTLDLYRLVDASQSGQPDVTPSTQHLRFPIEGGTETVRLSNDGQGPLDVSSISGTHPEFSVQPSQALIQPGDFVDLSIDYSGEAPGEGLILIDSDDPDESPLPIQVFGETEFLDIGDSAVPFTLETWTRNHEAGQFQYGQFELAAHAGQVVFFHVFSTG
jgi:hypothetical protein